MGVFALPMRAAWSYRPGLASRTAPVLRLHATSTSQSPQSATLVNNIFLAKQATAMFAAGAALGPFCDGLHSQHDVLHYSQPSVQLSWSCCAGDLDAGGLHWSFESCWWVPLLFGVAGLIIGVAVPLLDHVLGQKGQHDNTQQRDAARVSSLSWPAVMAAISLFVIQYWLSGVLEQPLAGTMLPGTPVPVLDAILLSYALALFAAADQTRQGFAMAALTAVCGPLIEVLLIRAGLYSYSHPAVLGVPTWIPWVYFAGGPAVGSLGRRVWRELAAAAAAAGGGKPKPH